MLNIAESIGLFHAGLCPRYLFGFGLLLGILALKADSIVPAMLAHFCNNAILIMLARSGLDRQMQTLSHRTLTLIVLASVALTGTGLAVLRSERQTGQM